MKILLGLLTLFMSLHLVQCAKNVATELGAAEFHKKMMDCPNAPVLDVRTPEEFSKGYLPGAINVDWQGENFDSKIKDLDKNDPVFVYCLSGGRSSSAAKHMRSAGFKNVWELQGGIMKWRAANLPEQHGSMANTRGLTREGFNQLLNTDKTVLVDFYADWCGPCKRMKPYLDEIASDMADKVVVVRINADDNQNICKELKIDALPVLQVYKNKTMTWSNTGYIEKEEVVKHF